MIYTFGTTTDAAQYIEEPDPDNPGQVLRPVIDPAKPLTLLCRNHSDLTTLPTVTVQTYGYFTFTTTDVPIVDVSADNGATWVPLIGFEAQASVVDLADQISDLSDQLNLLGNGPFAYPDPITGQFGPRPNVGIAWWISSVDPRTIGGSPVKGDIWGKTTVST